LGYALEGQNLAFKVGVSTFRTTRFCSLFNILISVNTRGGFTTKMSNPSNHIGGIAICVGTLPLHAHVIDPVSPFKTADLLLLFISVFNIYTHFGRR